jgi:CubicO group peptidase (beta-lactamase class C family)
MPRHLPIALLVVLATRTLDAQSGPARAPSSLSAQLDSALRARITDRAPGCVVGARRGQERVVLARGLAELESGRRLDTLSVLEAGSVSKQFTAAVLLRLAQAGRLSLDDTVRRHISQLPRSLPPFTVRQLLTHQAGLPEWGDMVALQGWPRSTADHAQAEIITFLTRITRTNFAPGAEYLYSNGNYVLATEVAARAGGASFADVSQTQLFAPLGLTDTRWRTDFRAVVPRRAPAFTTNAAGTWQLDMPYEGVVGHGGLLTTVPDLLTWLDALNGTSAFGSAFAREMERVGVLRSGRVTSYALGLDVDGLSGERAVSHAGATAGYRAYAGRVPSKQASVAILCNNGDLNTEELGPEWLALVAGLPLPAYYAQPVLGDTARSGVRATMAGRFRNERSRAMVMVRAFAEGLAINTWTAFRARSDSARSFASDDGQRALTMSADANRYAIVAGGDTVHYTRVPVWSPARATLSALADAYHDPVTGTTWTVTAADGGLRVSPHPGRTWTLQPLYPDAFRLADEGFTVTVERDARGQARALAVWTTRSRGLRLVRRSP